MVRNIVKVSIILNINYPLNFIHTLYLFITTAAKMNEITKNFKLGFGSFVDKVVSPFVSMVPEK